MTEQERYDMIFLQSEIVTLSSFLERLPVGEILERVSLQSRLEDTYEKLAAFEHHHGFRPGELTPKCS